MKRIVLVFVLIYLAGCTSAPVKKTITPPKTVVKESKLFLKYVKKEDKAAFDEIKDDQRILHLHSTQMSKATEKIDFWSALDPEEFNTQFSANMYTKEGNDYIYRVCGTAKKEKYLLVDFLNYDFIIIRDVPDQTHEMDSIKEKYEPLIVENIEVALTHCQEFKDIICAPKTKKGVKKVKKEDLIKDIKNPHLNEEKKLKSQNIWYELNFCEAVKFLK